MFKFFSSATILAIVIAVSVGCSSANTDISTPARPTSDYADQPSHYILGVYHFTIDKAAGTLDVEPIRSGDIHLNALVFLEPPALVNLTLDSLIFNGNTIDADIGLRHPFLGMTEFTGFDVCGILISHGSISGFTDAKLVLPGKDDKERAEELKRMILYAHKYGFQLGIHTVGSQATGLCIESFIQAEREEPKGLRHYIIHGDFISDRDIDLAARHSIGLNAQPVLKWVFSESIDRAVGEELSARQWPLRKIIDAGVHVSAGSDAPVTAPDWLQGIQYAVRRVSRSGTVRGPEYRITVAEAIRLFTMGGAWQDHAEHIKGSLEAGKLADLCILDQDILSVEPHSIKDIRTLMTIVDGKIVYDAEQI